jgi:hypothetical protein
VPPHLTKCDSTQAMTAINPDATAMPAPNAANRAFHGFQRAGLSNDSFMAVAFLLTRWRGQKKTVRA